MPAKKIWILWMLVLIAGYDLPSRASGIDAAMRSEDKRLNIPVTLSERHIYLGELLERLSKQTGIPIFMNERKSASGLQLMVDCTKTPVADVLDGIRSLLSNGKAEWTWFRAGDAPSYNYQLFPARDPADRVARLRHYAQTALETYVDLMIRLAYETPEERRRNKHKISEALNQPDDKFVNSVIDLPDMWNQVRLFAEATPPEQRLQVVRGQQDTRVAVKDLSPETQKLYHDVWTHFNSSSNGVPDPEPETLHIYAKPLMAPIPDIVPIIWFDLGENHGSMSIMGAGYSLEDGVRNAIKKLWLLPGDAVDSPAAQREIASVASDLLQTVPQRPLIVLPNGRALKPHVERPVELRLSQLAQGAALPVLALFPSEQGGDPGDPSTRHTVQGFLDRFAYHFLHPMYKWRGNILLAAYPAWFLEDNEDQAVGYELVKRYLLSKDGIISLPDLLGLFSTINEEQMRYLAQDHRAVDQASELFPLFSLFARFPEITSPDGMLLDAEKIAALRSLLQNRLCASIIYGNATALRLSEHSSLVQEKKVLTIEAEMLSTDKHWLPLYRFDQVAAPPRSLSK